MSFSSSEEDCYAMQKLTQGVLEEEMDIALEGNIECGEIKPNDFVIVKISC